MFSRAEINGKQGQQELHESAESLCPRDPHHHTQETGQFCSATAMGTSARTQPLAPEPQASLGPAPQQPAPLQAGLPCCRVTNLCVQPPGHWPPANYNPRQLLRPRAMSQRICQHLGTQGRALMLWPRSC